MLGRCQLLFKCGERIPQRGPLGIQSRQALPNINDTLFRFLLFHQFEIHAGSSKHVAGQLRSYDPPP